MPVIPPYPGQDENILKNGNLLVPKRYVDQSIPNLSKYATKDEIPDLTEYAIKIEMYYEGDPKKDLRIKYQADRSDNEANHKNNIYIGGFFTNEESPANDWQNVIIGLCSTTYSYRNVILGNNSNCDGCEAVCIGAE
jgi:hypothetical protein